MCIVFICMVINIRVIQLIFIKDYVHSVSVHTIVMHVLHQSYKKNGKLRTNWCRFVIIFFRIVGENQCKQSVKSVKISAKKTLDACVAAGQKVQS